MTSKKNKGIINKKGKNGTLYLTIAPVTVVVKPINKNDNNTTQIIQTNKFVFLLLKLLLIKQNRKNNKINKFSKDAINSVNEWLS